MSQFERLSWSVKYKSNLPSMEKEHRQIITYATDKWTNFRQVISSMRSM